MYLLAAYLLKWTRVLNSLNVLLGKGSRVVCSLVLRGGASL